MLGKDIELWIKDYLSEIDFTKEDFSISKIKEDLKTVLEHEPAIDIQRVRYGQLNESTKKTEMVERITKVTVVYVDGETDAGLPIVRRIPLVV